MIIIPRVSVGIPTYNRAATLGEAVQSILDQTFRDFELIISDNASTDGTSELVETFRDPRIRYIRNSENLGMMLNFNLCFKSFKGIYCAFLGSDDYWLPGFLENAVEALESNPDAAIAFTNHYFLQRGRLTPRKRLVRPGLHKECVSMILKINPICLAAALIRKAAFDEIDGFRPEVFSGDFDLYLRLAKSGHKMYYVDRLLSVYRLHEGNESRNWRKGCEGMIKILANTDFASPKDERLKRKKLALFYRQWGLALFQAPLTLTALDEVRSAFKESLHLRPFSVLTWICLVIAYLPKQTHPVIFRIRKLTCNAVSVSPCFHEDPSSS
jgi:glycosyltransferase involved in cell wall biosynthesis